MHKCHWHELERLVEGQWFISTGSTMRMMNKRLYVWIILTSATVDIWKWRQILTNQSSIDESNLGDETWQISPALTKESSISLASLLHTGRWWSGYWQRRTLEKKTHQEVDKSWTWIYPSPLFNPFQFELLPKPKVALQGCKDSPNWKANNSSFCKTQPSSIHWRSSSIFPCSGWSLWALWWPFQGQIQDYLGP